MSTQTIIGIDPGSKGGIAVIPPAGEPTVYPYGDDTLLDLAHAWAGRTGVYAYVERTHAMPQQGVVSTWTFGAAHGFILGVLAAAGIPVTLVDPQRWKWHFNLLKRDKSASIAKAHELYPGITLRRSSRCRTDSDGMAEALLIATYGKTICE